MYVWTNVFICNKIKHDNLQCTVNVYVTYSLPNQLAEAVCQWCSYENLIWKAHAKNL